MLTVVMQAAGPLVATAQSPEQPLPFEKLAAECAPDIHPTTLKGVVTTESSWNPYAIGVVNGQLDRQPRNLAEAVATARDLERRGLNFSMGLGQVNRHNLAKYGETYETVFDPCRNLRAGGAILKDCYQRAKAQIPDEQKALRAAFSCYYSGNFLRGFRPDKEGQPSYVQKVVANAIGTQQAPIVPAVQQQSTDEAVPVRAVSQKTGITAQPVPASAQWVTFTDSQTQSQNHKPATGQAETSPVKVKIASPSNSTAPAAPKADTARSGHAQTSPNPHVAPDTAPQDTRFVQFVNYP